MRIGKGYLWLETVANTMRAAIDNGAAPTPKRLTVRELIGHFGFMRRGFWINRDIRHGLEKYGLTADPDFAVGWIDSWITIRLDSDEPDSSKLHVASDPTNRIGSLEAANNKPTSVQPDNPLHVATTKMQMYDYSQLPVMEGEYKVAGIVTWKSIGERLLLGRKCERVRDCMDPAEELPVTTPLFDAIPSIAEHGYVLVRGADNTVTGIVTASDLSLQFMQLTGPFLFIGEIEGYLRHLIHGRFTLEQLREASLSEEGPSIEGSGDLTLGAYARLLGDKDNWKRLDLNIDRAEFVRQLDEVRQIRNGVMHFNPDGLSEDETRKLRDIARFFGNLARMGAI